MRKNTGGMLTFFAKGEANDAFLELYIGGDMRELYEDSIWTGNYKIKLYTTLSAHSSMVPDCLGGTDWKSS